MLFGCVSLLPDQLVHSVHPAVAEPLEFKANAGELLEHVAGAGKVPPFSSHWARHNKSITGAGVIRVERRCPCEDEAGCALNLSHQSAKFKFSIAFTCINSKTTNCFVLLGFGFLHIRLHCVLNKHFSDSFP